MRIKISYEGAEGFVAYNEKTQEISIDFEDVAIREEVREYLHTQRSFIVPESNVIDDFRQDFKFPYEDVMYFELAMSELYAHTGVLAHW